MNGALTSAQLETVRAYAAGKLGTRRAIEAGRNPPQRDLWSGHDPEIRETVRAVIEQARGARGTG